MKKRLQSILIVIFLILLSGCTGNERINEKEYLKAKLDLIFQGDSRHAAQVIGGKTAGEFAQQYEELIHNFVANNITDEAEVTDKQFYEFGIVCKEIFRSMRYEVLSSEELEKNEFSISVRVRPVDVFLKFIDSVQEEARVLQEKAERGEYEGEREEIEEKMREEFIVRAHILWEEAYKTMEYSEDEILVMTVKKDRKNQYQITDEQIQNMLEKILRLDEIMQ